MATSNGGAVLAPTANGAAAEASAKPAIYLSFDDGPSLDGGTSQLLDVLARHNAKVTFFINGVNVTTPATKESLRRVLAEGHALGSHSYQHLELDKLSDDEIVNVQLKRNHDLVKSVTGHDMACFRSPWGSTYTHERELALIRGFGYQVENYWGRNDASDYTFENLVPSLPAGATTAERAAWEAERKRIIARATADKLATATGGETFLLHDGVANKSATVAGIELFLAEHGDDYTFLPIPGCGGDSTPPITTPPTTTAPTTTPPPAGPVYNGPVAGAATVEEILAASDYTANDANYLRLYHALLAREPDVAGAKYWLAQSRVGSTLDDVAWGFSQSTEFVAKYGNLDDAAFVTTVYGNVLGRTPDAAGRNYWLGEVTSGRLSRHSVVRWIAESNEFKAAHPYAPT
ncbi:MAG: DUF4214 domain-containing protein [Acidimicrobiales bacterium]